MELAELQVNCIKCFSQAWDYKVKNVEDADRKGASCHPSSGSHKKGMDKYVERIPGSVNINELQNLLGTAHILRKFLKVNSLLP